LHPDPPVNFSAFWKQFADVLLVQFRVNKIKCVSHLFSDWIYFRVRQVIKNVADTGWADLEELSPELNVVQLRVRVVEVQDLVNVVDIDSLFCRQETSLKAFGDLLPFLINIDSNSRGLLRFNGLSYQVYLLKKG